MLSTALGLVFAGESVAQTSPPTTGLLLQLEANTGITLDGSGGVSTWSDQSGNGHNATQSTAGNRPTVTSNVLNGYPVVHFAGSPAQYLSLPNFLSGASAAEVLVVVRATGTSADSGLWRFGSSSSGDYYSFSDGQIYNGFGSTGRYSEGQPSQSITQFHVYEACSQAGSWQSWIDGIPFFSSTTNTVGFSSAPLLGDNNEGYCFAGDIAEIVIYNRALGASDRQQALGYLMQKYAIGPAPLTPTGLAATELSPSENLISWDWTEGDDEVTFVIVRAPAGGAFSQIGTVTGAATYLDTAVSPGQTYFYSVYAENYLGSSGLASEVGVSVPMAEGGVVATAGLKLWLMADGVVESPIGYWQDFSGNGNNAWQTTYGNRPTLSAGVLNGKPVVHFVGTSNQYVSLPNLLSGASAAEVLVVVRSTGTTADSGLWRFGSSSSGDYYSFTDGQIYNGFGSTGRYSEGQPSQSITQFHVYEVCSEAGSWQSWIDGIPFYDSATNTVGFSSAPLIGRNNEGYSFSGDIAEIVVYNRALSGTERQGLLTYVTQKYDLGTTPATPSGLMANVLNPSSALVTWNSPVTNQPIYYALWRQANSDPWEQIANVNSECTFIDEGLDPSASYQYELQAVNFNGASAFTTPVSLNRALPAVGDLPTAGLQLWLMADGILESPVGYWEDFSGNGHDAWQNIYANRPTVSTNVLNGKPVAHFVGSSSQFLNLPNLLSGASAAEVLVVLRATSTTNNSGLWRFGSNSSNGDYYSFSDGQLYNGFGSTSRYSTGLPPQAITQFHLYEVCSQSGSWQSWIDGVENYQSTTNTVGFSSAPLLGENSQGACFSGDIAEILVYNRALTTQERLTCTQYFAVKYLLGGLDADGDGLTNAQKLALGLNPYNPNPTGDGLWDSVALSIGLNPLTPITLYPNPNGPPSPTPPAPAPGTMVITLSEPAGAVLYPSP